MVSRQRGETEEYPEEGTLRVGAEYFTGVSMLLRTASFLSQDWHLPLD